MTDQERQDWVRAHMRATGLPAKCEDPVVLANVARIVADALRAAA